MIREFLTYAVQGHTNQIKGVSQKEETRKVCRDNLLEVDCIVGLMDILETGFSLWSCLLISSWLYYWRWWVVGGGWWVVGGRW